MLAHQGSGALLLYAVDDLCRITRTYLKRLRTRGFSWLWLPLLLCAGVAVTMFAGPVTSAVIQNDLVIITKLNDVDLGHWDGQRRRRRTEKHCVASTAHQNLFNITITGDGPGGSFLMENGAAFLPYFVEYRDQGGGGFKRVYPGVPLLYQEGAGDPFNCKNQKQRLRITVLGIHMTQVPAGIYSGTLTLTVAPM